MNDDKNHSQHSSIKFGLVLWIVGLFQSPFKTVSVVICVKKYNCSSKMIHLIRCVFGFGFNQAA